MNINMDYSFLFGSSSSGSSVAGSTFLSDYASIKNGSYYKLMKAYYAKNTAEDSKSSSSNSTSKEGTQKLASIQSETDALQKSADALITKGSKSLFKQKEVTKENEDGSKTTTMEYDMDAIYKGVKSFVDNYNGVISSVKDSNATSVLRQASNLTKTTKAYSNLLNKVGISVGSNNKLSIDEETFKAADISSIKSLFNGSGSYAYNVSTKASMLGISARSEAGKGSFYNAAGSYGRGYSSGNIFSSYF